MPDSENNVGEFDVIDEEELEFYGERIFGDHLLRSTMLRLREAKEIEGKSGKITYEKAVTAIKSFLADEIGINGIPRGNDEYSLRRSVAEAVKSQYGQVAQANSDFLKSGDYHITDESAGGNASNAVWQGEETPRLAVHIYIDRDGNIKDYGNKGIEEQILKAKGMRKATFFHFSPTRIGVPDPGKQVDEIEFDTTSKEDKLELDKLEKRGLTKSQMILKMSALLLNKSEADRHNTDEVVPTLMVRSPKGLTEVK